MKSLESGGCAPLLEPARPAGSTRRRDLDVAASSQSVETSPVTEPADGRGHERGSRSAGSESTRSVATSTAPWSELLELAQMGDDHDLPGPAARVASWTRPGTGTTPPPPRGGQDKYETAASIFARAKISAVAGGFATLPPPPPHRDRHRDRLRPARRDGPHSTRGRGGACGGGEIVLCERPFTGALLTSYIMLLHIHLRGDIRVVHGPIRAQTDPFLGRVK